MGNAKPLPNAYEGLVRNIAAFNRFIDSIAFSHGELLNYSNIARDCGIDAKTVKEYYQILVDTLVGYLIYPYTKKVNLSGFNSPKLCFVIYYLNGRKQLYT